MKTTLPLLTVALCFIGCSGSQGGGTGGGNPPPQNAVVSGPYSAVLTSTKGNGTTNVYTNLVTQSSTSFYATNSTLVCQGNIPNNCLGNDAPAFFYTLTGTVNGISVQVTSDFTTTNGAGTTTLVGTVNGTNISGTYTDTLGDAGTWTATQAASLSGTYSGSVNSATAPLTIAPTITASITEGQNFALTGTATVSNSPCFTTLNFGSTSPFQSIAIGGALTLWDTTNNLFVIVLPTSGNSFTVQYQVGSPAPACVGEYGTGTVTKQ
jgi:hypothetical protein